MRIPDLILYHRPWCGYCTRVERVLDELDLQIEHRDVDAESHREELRQARGRITVPVLRILAADGSETWMPESLDIVAYLRRRFGRG